ncbi:Crp/Fnr family transcriptional regulator [Methylorubrum zatmanii]|uniref:Crp/Fnr family transcriptional regulator n=1 Tax=Methylorubrum zatmanii TaxID=29429 RepID=A0ABW1WW32_9HYPH|nr:helix-turn-helix domain-containing protein [Methylorubrum zatmanii]MBD8907511.1 CarD family transcriptional regulator [Methylorubrum zatmanii]
MVHPQQATIRNRLLRAISSEDFSRLAPFLQCLELAVQTTLIAPDRPVEHLYFPESGIFSITANGPEGGVEVGMVGREGLVGAVPILTGSDRIPHDHFVQVPGRALRIAVAPLHEAVEESEPLRALLLRYLQAEIVQIRQTAFANARFTIEARLARWLLMCHDRLDGDEVQIKHDFLALMLGVQRSGVTLALQNLEGAGRIRSRRGCITVLDRALLEALADTSYGVAEAEYARLIEGA